MSEIYFILMRYFILIGRGSRNWEMEKLNLGKREVVAVTLVVKIISEVEVKGKKAL